MLAFCNLGAGFLQFRHLPFAMWVLAFCNLGAGFLQFRHLPFAMWVLAFCNLGAGFLQFRHLPFAMWVLPFCNLGAGFLQFRHLPFAMWVLAFCNLGAGFLQFRHLPFAMWVLAFCNFCFVSFCLSRRLCISTFYLINPLLPCLMFLVLSPPLCNFAVFVTCFTFFFSFFVLCVVAVLGFTISISFAPVYDNFVVFFRPTCNTLFSKFRSWCPHCSLYVFFLFCYIMVK